MSISQRGPRKRLWRFGVLDEYYSGILYTLPSTQKKSPSKAIFLAQSKIFYYLCNRLGKAIPITTYFSIAL